MSAASRKRRNRRQHDEGAVPPGQGKFLQRALLVLGVAALVFVTWVLTFRPVSDPDTWFHLALGKWITANGQLPRTDVFSYTADGNPYVPSGWLSGLLMYWLDQVYPESSLGPILMVTVVILVAVLIIAWRALRVGAFVTTAILLFITLNMAAGRFSPRPDVWSMLGTVILLSVLSSGWSRPSPTENSGTDVPPIWHLWLLVPLMALWSNLHAGVIVALPLLGTYGLWLAWRWKSTRARVYGMALLPVSAACMAWLLNPYGWGPLWLALKISGYPEVQWVMEWMPFFKSGFPLVSPVYASAAVVTAVLIYLFIWRRRQLHAVEIAWIVILVGMALLQRRQISLLAVGLPLLAARHLAPVDGWLRLRPWVAVPALLATAGLVFGLQVSGVNGTGGGAPGYRRNCSVLPCYTAEFLAANRPPQRIFNSYNMGGYLVYTLTPETPVYIDGRLDVYPHQVWLDMLAVEESRLGIDELVDKYKIETFAISIADSFGDPAHLASRLAARQDYVLTHLDDVAAVFVRVTDETAAYVREHGLRVVSPWDLVKMSNVLQDQRATQRLVDEIGVMLINSGQSATANALAAFVAWRAGDGETMAIHLAAAHERQPGNRLLGQVQRLFFGRGR